MEQEHVAAHIGGAEGAGVSRRGSFVGQFLAHHTLRLPLDPAPGFQPGRVFHLAGIEVGAAGDILPLVHLLDLIGRERAVEDSDFVYGTGCFVVIRVPGRRSDAQRHRVGADGKVAGMDAPDLIPVDVADHILTSAPCHRQVSPDIGGDFAHFEAVPPAKVIPDLRVERVVAHAQDVAVAGVRLANDFLVGVGIG